MTDRIIIPTAKDGLVLRQLTNDDRTEFGALADRNYSQIASYLGEDHASDQKMAECKQVGPTRSGQLRFGICENEEIVGFIRLTPRLNIPGCGEIGYWLGSEFTGRHLATNAVRTLSTFGFETRGLRCLHAWVLTKNIRSQNVLARAAYVTAFRSKERMQYTRGTSYPAE